MVWMQANFSDGGVEIKDRRQRNGGRSSRHAARRHRRRYQPQLPRWFSKESQVETRAEMGAVLFPLTTNTTLRRWYCYD
jgi:hypothetical protein